jgi:anti-anti-sigma regulatory factor
MIKLEADPSKNLLTIRYAGSVGPGEVERGLDDVRAGLAQLESGFRLLADLSELQSMDVACAPFIEKAMDMCNEKGASMVVRVIPDPHRDIGLQIMSIFHYDSNVLIINCETLDEAEGTLREPPGL